jgi:hypothetical protein
MGGLVELRIAQMQKQENLQVIGNQDGQLGMVGSKLVNKLVYGNIIL